MNSKRIFLFTIIIILCCSSVYYFYTLVEPTIDVNPWYEIVALVRGWMTKNISSVYGYKLDESDLLISGQMRNGYLYLIGEKSVIQVDILDPPKYMEITAKYSYLDFRGTPILVKDNYILLSSVDTIELVNVGNAQEVVLEKIYQNLGLDYYSSALLEGEVLFASPYDSGLLILDVDSLPIISEIAYVPGVNAVPLAIYGDYLYLRSMIFDNYYFVVVDISEQINPQVIFTSNRIYNILDMDIQGSIAYAISSEGLFILDLEQPDSPKIIRYYKMCRGKEIEVDGNFAYIINTSVIRRFEVYDISDPGKVKIVYEDSNPSFTVDLVEYDGIIFVIEDNEILVYEGLGN